MTVRSGRIEIDHVLEELARRSPRSSPPPPDPAPASPSGARETGACRPPPRWRRRTRRYACGAADRDAGEPSMFDGMTFDVRVAVSNALVCEVTM